MFSFVELPATILPAFFYFCGKVFCNFFTTSKNPIVKTRPNTNDNGAFFTNPAKIYVINDIPAHESAYGS